MFSGCRKDECTVVSPIAGLGSGITCVSCHPGFCKGQCLKPDENSTRMHADSDAGWKLGRCDSGLNLTPKTEGYESALRLGLGYWSTSCSIFTICIAIVADSLSVGPMRQVRRLPIR